MRKQLTFLLTSGVMLVMPGLVAGQVFVNFSGAGDGVTWSVAANWETGVVPNAGERANIGDGFSATLETDQSVDELDLVGDQSNGTASLDHTAGTLTSTGWLKVGGLFEDIASEGTYTMSGTASAVGQTSTQIGFAGGTGTFLMSDTANFETTDGLNIASGNAGFAGVGDNSIGTFTIADNATVTAGRLNVAGGGSIGTVNQTGGSVSCNNWVALAVFNATGGPGGTATYNISAGSVAANNGNFAVGQEGDATLNVSGTAVVTQAVVVDTDQENDAILVGGISSGDLIIDGTGTVNISGSLASITGADLRVGLTPGSSGTLSWTADAGGITSIVSVDNTEFAGGAANLVLDLSADPASATAGTEYLLIDNGAAVEGTFTGISEGDTVSIGGGSEGTISYAGGADGFDIVVTAVGGGSVLGDFSGDGNVDCDDIDLFAGTFGSVAEGSPASRDLTGDGTVDMADALELIQMLVVTSPNGVTGTFVGDLNCDGSVDVLGDAFILVANLGTSSGAVYTDGDLNFDGAVTVLGDAFAFVANLNSTNES